MRSGGCAADTTVWRPASGGASLLRRCCFSPPPICGCCCGASYPEYQIPMKMKEPKDEIRSRRWPKVNVLLVAAALLVPFTLFMWRIFGTKETPQQEGAAGINFSVPEGREQQIESSKQKVVAKVRTEALQAQRLLTLGEESFSLLDDRTEQPPSRQNPMQEADEANRALQRQLAQTYAPRTSEREVEHLRRQVEELSARLDAPPAASADPLELAERQYQLAQKYLGGGTPHIDTIPAERGRLCVLRPVPERALTASTLGAAAVSSSVTGCRCAQLFPRRACGRRPRRRLCAPTRFHPAGIRIVVSPYRKTLREPTGIGAGVFS